MFCSYTNPYKLSLCQPHSQGLSSSHPSGERERRDPGKGWLCATLTIENISEGSSLIMQFVMLSLADFIVLGNNCHYLRCLKTVLVSIPTFT